MRVAAVQLEVALGDVTTNLEACERLARAAAADGAEVIALPEFFTTGAAFLPSVAESALAPDGAATAMLSRVAREANVLIGGSFLCRDPDGEVRNAFLLAARTASSAATTRTFRRCGRTPSTSAALTTGSSPRRPC